MEYVGFRLQKCLDLLTSSTSCFVKFSCVDGLIQKNVHTALNLTFKWDVKSKNGLHSNPYCPLFFTFFPFNRNGFFCLVIWSVCV